ncbi:MAG: acyl-CoA dehydrogenase family protein, partial [Chloroflexota bacterium]
RMETYKGPPSFAKALFLGEIHPEAVFPFPRLLEDEQERVNTLVAAGREFLNAHYDPRRVEAQGWVGDDIIQGLGERGLLGLYLPEQYGGQGLSQTAYCQVFEALTAFDPTLSVVLGVHQSIGMKPIALYGSEEQKARFLPDLAAGRKLAGFALTEPNAGSDAYHIESRASVQADGSYLLNGEKRYIGNGSKDVLVVFARDDEGDHIALIVEGGMDGFEVGRAYDTLGLRGNDLRHLYFRDVRVPPENVLSAPGEGFKIAVETLNSGRLSLGTGSVGAVKLLRDMAVEHTLARHQFGMPLAEFELVQEKIAWMEMMQYGFHAMAYLITGMVDGGMPDFAVETAMVKVAGTELLWYAVNRAFQLVGGEAYIRDKSYEKILRDVRIFPIFEGANDVLRIFIALSCLEPLGKDLSELTDLNLREPLQTLGTLADYLGKRMQREFRSNGFPWVHTDFKDTANSVTGQIARIRRTGEALLREHGEDIQRRQHQLRRLSEALTDIFAQVATLSRISTTLAHSSGDEHAHEARLAWTFCRYAAARVTDHLDAVDDNDDAQIQAIAQHIYTAHNFLKEGK